MENKISIYAKLLKVQEELSPIMKDKDNPFFKSKYADINSFIEAIKPVLNTNKLILLQPLTDLNGTIAIKTILADAETGETLEDTIPIITREQDPQKIGSAITYYRRYALQSLLLIQAEDDDGNATKPAPVKTVAKPVTKADPRTAQIKELLQDLGHNPKTVKEASDVVFNLTTVQYKVENYDDIISELTERRDAKDALTN
jgi:hypothetical protein